MIFDQFIQQGGSQVGNLSALQYKVDLRDAAYGITFMRIIVI